MNQNSDLARLREALARVREAFDAKFDETCELVSDMETFVARAQHDRESATDRLKFSAADREKINELVAKTINLQRPLAELQELAEPLGP